MREKERVLEEEEGRTNLGGRKSGEWRIGEQRDAITSRGSRLVGGGCMNNTRQ